MVTTRVVTGIVILFVTAARPTIVAAAERQVTLSQAIALAMEDNHEMRATKNSLLAQRADIGIARGSLLPQVGFEQRAVRTDNPPGVFMAKLNQERFTAADFAVNSLNHPAPVTDLQSMVTLDQPIFVGKALVGLTMARKEYAAKGEDYRRKKEETTFSVTQGLPRRLDGEGVCQGRPGRDRRRRGAFEDSRDAVQERPRPLFGRASREDGRHRGGAKDGDGGKEPVRREKGARNAPRRLRGGRYSARPENRIPHERDGLLPGRGGIQEGRPGLADKIREREKRR